MAQTSQNDIFPIFNLIFTGIQIISTLFLAWYVNYVVKKKFVLEKRKEKQLGELYRPMDIIIKICKLNYNRYLDVDKDEQKYISDLWLIYNRKMKEIIMGKSNFFIEKEILEEIYKLLLHIDAYEFDYQKYKNGSIVNPFPGERGYPFPTGIEQYFNDKSKILSQELGAK